MTSSRPSFKGKSTRIKYSETVQIPEAFIGIRLDGILHTVPSEELEVDLETAQTIFQAADDLADGRSFKGLITTKKFAIPTKEAREFLASDRRNKFVIAEAFVIHSLSQKIIGNFYLKVDKPPRPTRLFNSETEALRWLKQF